MSTDTITVNGIEVQHPDVLRIRIRDLKLLVDLATFPVVEWRTLLHDLRMLLLLAELVHPESADVTS